jgi:hypothetical protein
VLPHLLQRVLEAWRKQCGRRQEEQIANVIVAGDLLNAKQRHAVGGLQLELLRPRRSASPTRAAVILLRTVIYP